MANEISPEQFKLNHLNRRIADVVIQYEDKVADLTIDNQILRQELLSMRERVQELTNQLEAREQDATNDDEAFDLDEAGV